MRHIAIQRTSTVNWAITCPYCNYRKITCPHILDALEELHTHIVNEHPVAVHRWRVNKENVNQLVMAFGHLEVEDGTIIS